VEGLSGCGIVDFLFGFVLGKFYAASAHTRFLFANDVFVASCPYSWLFVFLCPFRGFGYPCRGYNDYILKLATLGRRRFQRYKVYIYSFNFNCK